jgi:hypothetical protein
MNKKIGYYSADSVRGVIFHGKDFVDYDNIMRPVDFYDDLPTVGEVPIYTYIDFDNYAILLQIEAEYTID